MVCYMILFCGLSFAIKAGHTDKEEARADMKVAAMHCKLLEPCL